MTIELENLSGQNGFSPFSVQNDSSASGGQYIVWPNNGDQLLSGASDGQSGTLAVSFELSQTANVSFGIRASLANGNDDSFYYKLDSGVWSTQNNTSTSGFETLSPTTFNGVSAGVHTLYIQRREDGAKLDSLSLTASVGNIISSHANSSSSSSSSGSSSSSSSSSSSGGNELVIAINAGGGATSLDGVNFVADVHSLGGSTGSTTDSIAGATSSTLYQTERYGSYSYAVPVTNATYSLKLHFAEIYHTEAGARSFNLAVEGQQEMASVDLYSLSGHDGAYTYEVNDFPVDDGEVTISLESLTDNGTLSGFELSSPDGGEYVEPTPIPTPEPGEGGRYRVIHTTDMGADPDDEQSLVRQLVMANEYDLEGIITTTGCWKKSTSNTAYVDRILNAYSQDIPI